MPAAALADTGALLAVLNPKDPWHASCVEVFERLPLPMATSAAVVTELLHFIGSEPQRLRNAWKFLRAGTITVLDIGDRDLAEIEELMLRYADRPMDFADATLVHLAARESILTVFTIDNDDFETYRLPGKRKLRVVPGRP